MKNNLEEVFTPKTTEEIIKDQLELKEKAYQNYLLVHNYNDSISIREDFMAGFDEGAGLRGFFGRYSASLNDRNKQLELEQELQKAQEEINSLRSAYKKNIDSLSAGLSEDLLKILKTYPTALPYICEIKQELQKTREKLAAAIQLLRRIRNACSPSDIATCEQALKDFLKKQDKENKDEK